jgi:hypothetical protein
MKLMTKHYYLLKDKSVFASRVEKGFIFALVTAQVFFFSLGQSPREKNSSLRAKNHPFSTLEAK